MKTYTRINRNGLGQFKKRRGRMFHESAMLIVNPAAAIAELQGVPFFGPRVIANKPGKTYDVGRNKAKRERREAFAYL